MKKHHVNHPLPHPKRHDLHKNPKTSQAVAVGIAVAAALAVSSQPTFAGRQIDTVPAAVSPLTFETAAYSRPVEVSLMSGVDAIRWEPENITSAAVGVQVADASDPGATVGLTGTSGQFTSQLVGQGVGALGVLPGGIQLIHPVSSKRITSPYGWRNNPTGAGTQIHIGQDYGIACGSPVYASADGIVVQSAWAGHSGMRVTLDHGSSVRTGYSHNSRLIAKVGETVKQGRLIALSGTTGNSTGCHVHFEVIINGRWNDPRNFLPIIPGQPNPMIDSRGTTIVAERSRNSGQPSTESDNGHDIDVKLPERTKTPPSVTTPPKESTSPKPSEARPRKNPTPTPTQKPSPDGTPMPTPDASGEPTPTKTPAPETNPPPTPSEQTTPPTEAAESKPGSPSAESPSSTSTQTEETATPSSPSNSAAEESS